MHLNFETSAVIDTHKDVRTNPQYSVMAAMIYTLTSALIKICVSIGIQSMWSMTSVCVDFSWGGME